MIIHPKEHKFALVAEQDLDKVLLTAIMGALPYTASKLNGKNCLIFHQAHYQIVMDFITHIKAEYHTALLKLQTEAQNDL